MTGACDDWFRARDDWLRLRERKRAAVAVSSALACYLLLLGAALLLSLFTVHDLADFSGPVVVRLGTPDGIDAARPVPEVRRSPVVPEPPASPKAPAVSRPETTTSPAPAPADAPSPAAKAPVTPPAPQTPAIPASQAQPAPVPTPAPVVLRGSESGNSYDMTFLSGSGVIRRSLYEPIWLYMPLPFELPASTYEAIPDEAGLAGTAETRKKIFQSFYRQAGGIWQLKNFRQPDYESRPALWVMLEDAGYDLKNAEYKNDKHLRPVVILFKVSAPGADGKPKLEAVHIESGSGYSNIDDDVLYGFRKAEFSNSGLMSISGRFTYRF